METVTFFVLICFALVLLGSRLSFLKRFKISFERPLKTVRPTSGTTVEDAKSNSGSLPADDQAGRGASLRRAEARQDIKTTSIKQEGGIINVSLKTADDPIFRLGLNPVECGVADASENLDRYLYAADE